MNETDRVLAPPGRVWWADRSDQPMRTQTTTTQERTDPADDLAPEPFGVATETGETVTKDGWHDPDGRSFIVGHHRGCGCTKTTPKGAYRDTTVDMPDGRTIHYYHQNPVVVQQGTTLRLSACGWRTSTTKERINRYLPRGYSVRQVDFEWYLETPDERVPFEDGMTVEVPER